MDIYDVIPNEEKNMEWRFSKFREIAELGIPICIYVDETMYAETAEFSHKYENIKIAKTINLEDTFVGRTCSANTYTLPETRNCTKDTDKYMMLMNSKFEFMNDAVMQNLWNTTHFAWIDFSVSYIFNRKDFTLEYLKILSKRLFQKENLLVIPGCWGNIVTSKYVAGIDMERLLREVVWRFCGGFLLASQDRIVETFTLYREHFEEFLRTYKTLVWEVNFWAWLEYACDWKPRWYCADHNDTIIRAPVDIYATCIYPHINKMCYDYPKIESFEPMQCAHVEFNGRQYINTRYVNYLYLDSGYIIVLNENKHIITRNMVSELDGETMRPKYYAEMREEETIGLENKKAASFTGLEDIRLYVHGDKLKFIATNINYSPIVWNSMIVGEYDVEERAYRNSIIVKSPYSCWCEKNWIPITAAANPDAELFIYKWWPMEIGKIDYVIHKLEIIFQYDIKAPNFEKVRGSTTFVDGGGDYLLGLVHFSEETCPRQYYHILVALDKMSLKPMKYSDVIYFQHLGVEFCTGMKMGQGGDKYIFWVSKWDREPAMITVDVDAVELKYEFQ